EPPALPPARPTPSLLCPHLLQLCSRRLRQQQAGVIQLSTQGSHRCTGDAGTGDQGCRLRPAVNLPATVRHSCCVVS
ncbi:hypothetical protein NDU88_002136, partial [Pleurodeles waltl]